MSDLKVGIRLEGDSSSAVAATEAQRDALQRLDQAADKAAASSQRMAAGLGGVEAKARSAAVATAAQVNAALNVRDDFGAARRTADIEAYGAALDATRARLNPYVAAREQYLGQQREINEAVRIGAVTETEAARAHALNDQGYRQQLGYMRAVTTATRTQTGALKLQGWQMANLFQQVQDVFVQGAMGTNPFMIAAMQGPQITSAMGGVKNALALVKPYFTVTTVAIGGTTAALATGAVAWNSYLSSVKAVEAAASGRGRGLGFAPGDFDAMARSGADAAGISIKSAREAQVAFLNTGKIGKEVMDGLIAISKDYAATLGIDVSEAVADLADNFADPAKGMQEFQKSLDLLDDRTNRYIQTLIMQNRHSQAQLALYDALRPRMARAGDELTLLGRAWDSFGTSVSNSWDNLGRGIDSLVSRQPASEAYLAQLTAARDKAQRSFSGRALLEGVGIIDLEALNAEIATVRDRLDREREKDRQKLINSASTRAGGTARELVPGLSELDGLRQKQANLRPALVNPEIGAAVDDLGQVAAGYARLGNAINSYLTPAQRALETDRLAVAELTARTPAAKAEIAERQKRLELAGQQITAGEREAQVASAGALARASATQALADHNNALALNTRSALEVAQAYLVSGEAAQVAEARRSALTEALQSGASVEALTRLNLADAVAAQAQAGAQAVASQIAQADAQARINELVASGSMTVTQATTAVARDTELKPLIIARNNAEGEARVVLTQIIDRLTAAYDRLNVEQSRSAAQSVIQGQNDDIARMQLEISLIGRSASERAVALAVLQAEQNALAQGIPLRSAEGIQIVQNARRQAELNTVLDRQKDLYNELGNFGERSLDKINDAILENGLSLKTLSDVARAVVADMQTEFLKLAAINPLKNFAFGTNYATLGDAGGFIGSFFNAGVNHTGGLAGESGVSRIVPASTFANAQKRHSGGLAADEVPIIAKRREEVLTEDDPRHIFNLGKGGRGSVPVSVTNNVFTAPGTRATTRTKDDGKGNITLETIVEQVEDGLATRGASGQGKLFPAIGNKFGLNPNASRPRSGR